MKIRLYYGDETTPMTYKELYEQVKEENYETFCKDYLANLEPAEVMDNLFYDKHSVPQTSKDFEKTLDHYIKRTIELEYMSKDVTISEEDWVD